MPWHYVCCVSAIIRFSLLDHFCKQPFRMLEDITHIFRSQTLNRLTRRQSFIFFLDMPLNKSSFFFWDERLIHLAYEPSVAGAVLFPSPSPPTVSVVVREENWPILSLGNVHRAQMSEPPTLWALSDQENLCHKMFIHTLGNSCYSNTK